MSSSGPPASSARPESRETPAPSRMAGRVLVVDDTEARRYFIVKTLRRAGMEVLEAASGQEALGAAAMKPDVVVLDVRLPDMSGFEVCRRLKEDPATSPLAILYVSSMLRDEELEARLFEDGADGYLPQPLEPRHLVAQTWALVRMRRAEQARQREREEAQAERARLQHELERSQARALRLSESGLVGTFYWDLDGAILDANDTFLRMVGYTREDLERGLLDWRKMTPPEWWEQDQRNVQDVLRQKVSGLREKQYVRKDGTRVDVLRGAAAFESEPHRGVGVVVDISARRDAERRLAQLMEELESKERLLKAVLQQMPTGILITEAATGRTLLTNERMAQLLGGAPRQSLGQMRLHLMEHPDGRPCTREELPLVRAMGEGREVAEELVVHREDGSRRTTWTCASPVRDARGEIVAGVLTMEDITERKATQESLRLSEERVRLAMDTAALGVWSYDPATDTLEWDARTRELFGLAPGAPVDMGVWLALVHPEDRERMASLVRRGFAEEGGGVGEFEYRAVGDGGVLRWLAGRGRAHVGSDGKVRHMGTVLDITGRKLAEQHAEALLATTATFAHALTARQVAEALVSHGLKSLDACAGLVSGVAGEGVEVLGSIGYPEEMLRAVSAVRLSQALPIPEVLHTGRAVWSESIEALERDWPEAIGWTGLSRSRSWCSLPLRSEERVVGVLTLSFPTPRRFGEREKTHLESLCRLGAQALERARVYEEARQRAEQEQRFLGVVSHDLRNPLAAISLGARTLQRMERPTPEALLRMTGRIANSADTMGRMISDLLDFTRGRLGGGIPLERTHTELVRLCREVIDEFSVTHPSSDIRLEGDALCEGWWDGPRLRQVLSNLLSNALRHARPGSEVGVGVRGLDGEVELTVSNEGEPIPAELVPVLFEPFRRGMSKFRPAGSLGLGLFIVHQVVKGHGGRVEVGSAGGVTSFTVRVPRGA